MLLDEFFKSPPLVDRDGTSCFPLLSARLCGASLSPDLAGYLQIFDIIMKISRFGTKIFRFITKSMHLYNTTLNEQ